MAPCALTESSVLPAELPPESQDSELADHVHEMVGYLDCMEEALRYLVEQERYPDTHPAVQGLRRHLAEYQQWLMSRVLDKQTPETAARHSS